MAVGRLGSSWFVEVIGDTLVRIWVKLLQAVEATPMFECFRFTTTYWNHGSLPVDFNDQLTIEETLFLNHR